jgi:hypothetical protein
MRIYLAGKVSVALFLPGVLPLLLGGLLLPARLLVVVFVFVAVLLFLRVFFLFAVVVDGYADLDVLLVEVLIVNLLGLVHF